MDIQFCSHNELKPKPAVKDLVFGQTFTDHMLEVQWTEKGGWEKPKISPFHNLVLHPAAKSLHYATEVRPCLFFVFALINLKLNKL